VLADHPDLTMTGIYNVLEKTRADETLTSKEEDIKARGLVLIIGECHDRIDQLVTEAYGWAHDLGETETMERLVALNRSRVEEEARGDIAWLRADYQLPRHGRSGVAATEELSLEPTPQTETFAPQWPAD